MNKGITDIYNSDIIDNSSADIAPVFCYPPFGDENGLLSVIESNKNIPFAIKRVFYVYGTKSTVTRGRHAHYLMREVLIAVSGHCILTVDDGKYKQTISLDSPNKGILIEPYIWREMSRFSADCVLLAVSSELYDPADYIYDYNEFLKNAARYRG